MKQTSTLHCLIEPELCLSYHPTLNFNLVTMLCFHIRKTNFYYFRERKGIFQNNLNGSEKTSQAEGLTWRQLPGLRN